MRTLLSTALLAALTTLAGCGDRTTPAAPETTSAPDAAVVSEVTPATATPADAAAPTDDSTGGSLRVDAPAEGTITFQGFGPAKFGATAGLPWPVYYGVPAAATLALPPLAFRMQRSEFAWYVLLAFASSPAIHAVFSFFVGWHEYMPFWPIPSLWDMHS